MAEANKGNSIDYNNLELECLAVKIDDANTTAILRGATVAALTNDTIGTTAEDAYFRVEIAGTVYKCPLWADDA
jgi:hypothetical protein